MKKYKQYIIAASIVVFLIIIDQITKALITTNMDLYESIKIIDGFFSITYTINDGAAWSMFSGKMIFLILVSLVGIGFITYLWLSLDLINKKMYSISVILLASGAIGNLIDRIFTNGVIDFLDFIIFGYDFPIFNVADICLTIGVISFIIAFIFFEDDKKNNTISTSSDNSNNNEETLSIEEKEN